jgi:hypothetical protein
VTELAVLKRGSAVRVAAADHEYPTDDRTDNIVAAALGLPAAASGAAGQAIANVLRPAEVSAGQLLTEEEVSRALGQPVRARGPAGSPIAGPMSVELYHTVNGDKRALNVAVAHGPAAQLAIRMRRRYPALPGIGDEAYTAERWAAARRGDNVVLIQTHGPGRNIDPRNVYWLLCTAVGRLPG